ncbi:replication initiation protein [Myroides odoratimimus]|uniref:replication initiation protein n=1 Tax=Myroides odoratimimus TaxID=76832 RepID=UPI0025782A53|nr:replication initiation protein [Myroides odoratimimus]MDM1514358.1 replication initiation protein [Myroides odoratimimus]
MNYKELQRDVFLYTSYDYNDAQLEMMISIINLIEDNNHIYTLNLLDIENNTGVYFSPGEITNIIESFLNRVYKTDDSITYFTLFQYFKLNDYSVEFCITDIALNHLLQIKKRYPINQVRALLKCTSKHAKTLYVLAADWVNITDLKVLDIDDIKTQLNLIDSTGKVKYDDITAFKERVLDVAIKQLNKFTDIKISYKLIKEGRSFKHIQFILDRV